MPYTTTPPDHTTPLALSATAPTPTTPAGPDGTAPSHTSPAGKSVTAPTATTPAMRDGTAPDAGTSPYPTTLPAGTGSNLDTPLSLPPMPSIFTPAFLELDTGPACLKTMNASAADAAANRTLIGFVTQGGAIQAKTYRVVATTDAEALPGIVHPNNYNAVTNAVAFASA